MDYKPLSVDLLVEPRGSVACRMALCPPHSLLRPPIYYGKTEVWPATQIHSPSIFSQTSIDLPLIVIGAAPGGRIVRIKCPVLTAASSPIKSMRPCLSTRVTVPGGRANNPPKTSERTSVHPSTRKGCKAEIQTFLSDCKAAESNKSRSPVFMPTRNLSKPA